MKKNSFFFLVSELVRPRQIAGFLFLAVAAALYAFPVFMSFISAFRSNGEILRNPVGLPNSLYFDNFLFLFTRTELPRAFLNTLLLTAVSEIFIVAVVPMSSYAIARFPSKWTNGIYAFFIGGMMIPFQAYMISLFKELKTIGLFGTFSGAILIYLSGAVAFGTLLFTSFIKTTVPIEIEESARIDGANGLQVFWQIVFPLLSPCTASMVILNGLGIWNDFLMPSLLLSSKKPSALNVVIFHFVGQYNTRWNIVFAGAVICIIPAMAIFIALQKYFIKGIAAGAVKG
ncbi:MAG: carbohydrate ABC transporter permease [Treponema sp.]|jgi:raffinose/stachyose/melibiose transport system permease protein|nr:carbohydrate ABC transporter permease [Treponema sp.]